MTSRFHRGFWPLQNVPGEFARSVVQPSCASSCSSYTRAAAFTPPAAPSARAPAAPLRLWGKEKGLTEAGHVAEASGFSKQSNDFQFASDYSMSEADLQQCLQTGECELPGTPPSVDPPAKQKRGFFRRIFGRFAKA